MLLTLSMHKFDLKLGYQCQHQGSVQCALSIHRAHYLEVFSTDFASYSEPAGGISYRNVQVIFQRLNSSYI